MLRAASRVLVALLLLCPAQAARGEDEPAPADFLPHVPTGWITLAGVDRRARRPFNPDAVFERYLLDARSPTPHAGDEVTGRRGKATWTAAKPDTKGRIGGSIAWAYTRVHAPAAQIVMADLRHGATLFVNGTPHVGSIYGDRFEVPVRLRKGRNDLYVRGVRGAFALTLKACPGPAFVAPWRQTRPDLVVGEPVDAHVGLLVVNATEETLPSVSLAFDGNTWLEPSHSPVHLPIAPLGVLQLRLPLRSRPGKPAPTAPGDVELQVRLDGVSRRKPPQHALTLKLLEPTRPLVHTFVSDIDDSVQRFAVRRPTGKPTQRPIGLVLTLHGAGVDARGQAAAYAAKDDFWIVAPTNRDRFGFDWQDWGRLDAYEVLAEGLRLSGVDRRRVYLTGHSMGGHGTWHLGANDPDGFAAIAPSAGWISFDTYPRPRPQGKYADLWHAADGASRTRTLIENLVQLPTYILHGTKDDNVPVDQAHQMEKLLRAAGGTPLVHYEEGAGHWWDGDDQPGARCVDWPGIFDLFRKTEIASDPDEIHFTTVSPEVDARHHWIEVLRAVKAGTPCRVEARHDAATKSIRVQSENVAALAILHRGPRERVTVDGREVGGALAEATIWEGGPGAWSPRTEPRTRDGTPVRVGSFRSGWRHRFVLVRGTHGEQAEIEALLEQVRFDAQRWTYRANGRALIVRDDDVESRAEPLGILHGNRIYYGHVGNNTALARLENLAVAASRRRMAAADVAAIGEDLGACFVLGRHAGRGAVVASTGAVGSRLGFTLMLFVSGAGWPDHVVFDRRILTKGDGGVLAAGWYPTER